MLLLKNLYALNILKDHFSKEKVLFGYLDFGNGQDLLIFGPMDFGKDNELDTVGVKDIGKQHLLAFFG